MRNALLGAVWAIVATAAVGAGHGAIVRVKECSATADALSSAALGLTAGEVGAVVEILGDGEAFEVEFCDNSGHNYGLHRLRVNQIIALHTRGRARWLPV